MSEKLYKPLLIDSVKATADLDKQIFVGFDGGVCGEGEKAYGVCDVETDSGQLAPVAVLGILLVVAGGEITAGSPVTSDENGYAVVATSPSVTTESSTTTLATGDEINGYALDDASASGEVIRILRGI